MASKHIVTCVQCGKRFDANFGGYYNSSSRRYTCKSCGKVLNKAYKKQNAEQKAASREQKATEREAKTGMRQSVGAMIAKIAIGVLFVFAGFSSPEGGWTFGYFLTSLVVGAALISWGVIPYLNAQKSKNDNSSVEKEIVKEQVKEVKLCASCGASGTGAYCEYCGRKYPND